MDSSDIHHVEVVIDQRTLSSHYYTVNIYMKVRKCCFYIDFVISDIDYYFMKVVRDLVMIDNSYVNKIIVEFGTT